MNDKEFVRLMQVRPLVRYCVIDSTSCAIIAGPYVDSAIAEKLANEWDHYEMIVLREVTE
jgi:hypothetical protein